MLVHFPQNLGMGCSYSSRGVSCQLPILSQSVCDMGTPHGLMLEESWISFYYIQVGISLISPQVPAEGFVINLRNRHPLGQDLWSRPMDQARAYPQCLLHTYAKSKAKNSFQLLSNANAICPKGPIRVLAYFPPYCATCLLHSVLPSVPNRNHYLFELICAEIDHVPSGEKSPPPIKLCFCLMQTRNPCLESDFFQQGFPCLMVGLQMHNIVLG